MKTRCPCCGTTLSLDALVAHEAARAALACLFRIGGDLGAAICRYLALFRPRERELSMERVARLLEQVAIDITAGAIDRRGQTHLAPPEAWVWAIRQALDARDAGRLKTPLTGHGYLYEVLVSWPGPQPRGTVEPTAAAPVSKTARAIRALEDRAK
ncbi:MAG: hypothetical protein LBF91_08725 [Azoarcus sp.]|jgi:hypothetical protein|nr:hypothetical protein [Azoarcus sp.]